MQLLAGIIVGWLVANLVDGMRPVAWAKLVDEEGAKLIVRLERRFGLDKGGVDWGG